MTLLDTRDKVGSYKLTAEEKAKLKKWRENKLKINSK